MRAVTALVATLIAGLLLVSALASPMPASACSLPGFASPEERLQRLVDSSSVIVVGEVIDEERTGDWGNYPPQPRYASTVRTEAVLLGDAAPDVRIPELGALTADCRGAPRMAEGERVLLFLTHDDPRYAAGTDLPPAPAELNVAAAGQGKFLLVDGMAHAERAPLIGATDAEGERAERLLREIGRLAGSEAVAIERAVAFTEGAPPAAKTAGAAVNAGGGAPAPVWAPVVSLGVLGLLIALALWRWRARGSR